MDNLRLCTAHGVRHISYLLVIVLLPPTVTSTVAVMTVATVPMPLPGGFVLVNTDTPLRSFACNSSIFIPLVALFSITLIATFVYLHWYIGSFFDDVAVYLVHARWAHLLYYKSC
jgi:hypothetical protein